jgi:hypothetical protein
VSLASVLAEYLAGDDGALVRAQRPLMAIFRSRQSRILEDVIWDALLEFHKRGRPFLLTLASPSAYLTRSIANGLWRMSRQAQHQAPLEDDAETHENDADPNQEPLDEGVMAARDLRRGLAILHAHVDHVFPRSSQQPPPLDEKRQAWEQVWELFHGEITMDELIDQATAPQKFPKHSADWVRARNMLQKRHSMVRKALLLAIPKRCGPPERLNPELAAILRNLFECFVRCKK